MSCRTCALLAAICFALTAPAAVARDARSYGLADRRLFAEREKVADATVTLPSKGCAGAVVGRRNQILTAAHCIPAGAAEVPVLTAAGRSHTGVVAKIDRDRDTALLALEDELQVEPLEWSLSLPRPGARVLFVGRIDRPSRAQVARVERLAQCPSLPQVNDAIFTTLEAVPGDSGSPIVDDELRVLGVVHGGAACHIAVPVVHLADELGAGSSAPSSDRRPEPSPPVLATYHFGPFVFQKLEHGFRVRFHLSIGSDGADDYR